jgi:hypothetical protein
MKSSDEIYKESINNCMSDNCQSTRVIAINAITLAKQEMFNYIYAKAEKSKNREAFEFMDDLSVEIDFD